MLNFPKVAITVLAIGLSSAAFAQDAEPAVDPTLSTGEDLKAPAAEPEVRTEVFGDWTVNCQDVDGTENCQMYQLLKNGEFPIVEVNLFNVDNGSQVFAGGSIVVPLDTLLTAQLTIAVDDDLAKRYPYAFCTQTGCVSRVGLTEADITAYKKGNAATVSIVPVAAPDQKVEVAMSLKGFTKAFDALKAK